MKNLQKTISAALVIVLTVSLGAITLPATAVAKYSTNVPSSDAMEAHNLKSINEARVKKGKSKLVRSASLDKVAMAWAKKMSAENNFEHNPIYYEQYPDGWLYAAENIAWASVGFGARTPQVIHDGWMKSPGHYANIMESAFTHVGIAFYTDKRGKTWAVQNFAQYASNPDPSTPTPKPAPSTPTPSKPTPSTPTPSKPAPAKLVTPTISKFTGNKIANAGKNVTWKKVKLSHKTTLQRKSGSKWVNVKTYKAGTQTISAKAPKAGKTYQYRLYVPKTSKVSAKASATLKVKARKAGFASKFKSKTVKPGKTATWKGVKVSHTAKLQQKVNDSWKTVKNLKKGTHTIKLKASAKNKSKQYYRIVVAQSNTRTKHTSSTVTLTARR